MRVRWEWLMLVVMRLRRLDGRLGLAGFALEEELGL